MLLAAVCLIAGCSTPTERTTKAQLDELDGYIKAYKYTPFRPPRGGDGAGTMITYNALGQESTIAAASECLPPTSVVPETFDAGTLKTKYTINRQGGVTLSLIKVLSGTLDLDAALSATNITAVQVTLVAPFENRITWVAARKHLTSLPKDSVIISAAKLPGNLVINKVLGVKGVHYEFLGTNNTSLKITAEISRLIKLTPDLQRRFEGEGSLDITNTLFVGYRAWKGREIASLLQATATPAELRPTDIEQTRAAAKVAPKRTYSRQELIDLTKVSQLVADQIQPAVQKWAGAHPRISPIEGNLYPMRLYFDPAQESRVSDNFDIFDRDRRAKVTFLGVKQEDLKLIKATIMSDKPGRPDRPRSGEFGNNDIITISKRSPDNEENGNYVAGLSFPGDRIEFFKRNPNPILLIKLID